MVEPHLSCSSSRLRTPQTKQPQKAFKIDYNTANNFFTNQSYWLIGQSTRFAALVCSSMKSNLFKPRARIQMVHQLDRGKHILHRNKVCGHGRTPYHKKQQTFQKGRSSLRLKISRVSTQPHHISNSNQVEPMPFHPSSPKPTLQKYSEETSAVLVQVSLGTSNSNVQLPSRQGLLTASEADYSDFTHSF